MTGAIASFTLGKLNDYYTTEEMPAEEKGIIAGKLLTVAVAISYIGCCIPFVFGAYLYRNFILRQRAELKASKQDEINKSEDENDRRSINDKK